MSWERRIDLTGQRIGLLVVLGFDHVDKELHRYYWRCRCDCGTEFVTEYKCLRWAKTRSCGCIRSECARRHVALAYGASSIPVRVEGLGDFPSASTAARALNCSPKTLLKYIHAGKPYHGTNVTRI